jgi:hypothetical protein
MTLKGGLMTVFQLVLIIYVCLASLSPSFAVNIFRNNPEIINEKKLFTFCITTPERFKDVKLIYKSARNNYSEGMFDSYLKDVLSTVVNLTGDELNRPINDILDFLEKHPQQLSFFSHSMNNDNTANYAALEYQTKRLADLYLAYSSSIKDRWFVSFDDKRNQSIISRITSKLYDLKKDFSQIQRKVFKANDLLLSVST